MIQGVVNAACEVVVVITLQGPAGQVRDIEAVVDTGYSGFLTLAVAVVAELGLPFAYIGQAFLANDDEVKFDVHDVTVWWGGQPRFIQADATGGTPLVGMLLLDNHDLNVEVVDGGRDVIQVREQPDSILYRNRSGALLRLTLQTGHLSHFRKRFLNPGIYLRWRKLGMHTLIRV